MKKRLAVLATLVFALSVMNPGGVVAKEEEGRQFEFHAGDVFIETVTGHVSDKSAAANGDRIEIIATGELRTNGRKAEGTGSFVHRTGAGIPLAIGSFKAVRLMSFTDFGPTTGLPQNLHSGTAVIALRVIAHPVSDLTATARFDAILTIDCNLGNAPASVVEGIGFRILNGPAAGLNFNMKVSGETVFVAEQQQQEED